MMNTDVPLALVGNSLAVLVAATERARRGQRTLVVNPGGPWGGYLAGIDAGGERWDAGMVLYEFTSFRTPPSPPPLASYDAGRRNDIGRFCDAVRAYVSQQQPLRDIEPPQMWIDNRLLPDLLLANGLDALPQLDCAGAARAELRAGAATAASPWHASRKDSWAGNPWLDFDTVSRINHGRVLHEAVIEPFARKVLGRDTGHIAALFHRIAWLPLYWPQTLLGALDGKPQALPPTAFSYPHGARVADLCAALARRMAASAAITLRQERVSYIERTPDGFVLRLERSGRVSASHLAWAQTPRQGLAACGEPTGAAPEDRLPLLLVVLRVARAALRRDCSVVHAVAADTGIYRVSNPSHCAGEHGQWVRLVAEAHPGTFAARHGAPANDAAVVRAVIGDLARMGLVAEGCTPEFSHVLRLPGALPLPTAASLTGDADDRARLQRLLPGIELLGASAGAFATSISDQIVQGLRLAEAAGVAMPHSEAIAA